MRFFLILIYFLREEIKLNLRRIKIVYIFIKEFSVLRFFCYLINNSFIPARNKIFRNYISKNSQKWRNNTASKNLNNKNVLITNILHHIGYVTTEIIIGKNLMDIFNANGIALINYYDLKRILLFKSFGIDNIIILKNFNIFVRLKYFLKAYLIIKSCKNMDEFLKLSIDNVSIGKTVYDHYLRYSGVGTVNKFENQFYIYLAKCLLIHHQINQCFKKYKIIASVQSEVQFIPGAILFQCALNNGTNVYSRWGFSNSFSVRKFSNINEKYAIIDRYSKKLYDLINNNIRNEAIKIGGEILRKGFDGLIKYRTNAVFYDHPKFSRKGKKIKKIERKKITKEDLCKRFGWSHDSPIGMIFASDLTDGVFAGTWSLFRDRLTWLRETLREIRKVSTVNWLVKPHPNDEFNDVITSTISEYEKNCSNYNHVKIFPDDITIGSIPKFIDVALTQSGTPATEYPCFGIPTITSCETATSELGYTIEPRSKEDYFFQLQNAKKLKKLNNQQIELAKIYIFIYWKLTRITTNLIPPHSTQGEDVDETDYFIEMTKLLEEYNYENDFLKKMMEMQEINNDRHTLDYRMFNNQM